MHVGSIRWSVSRGNGGRIQSERYTRYRSVYTHSTHPLTDHALLDATASTPIPLERDLSRTHQSFGYISWLSRLIFQSRFSVCFSYFVIIKRLNRCASLSYILFFLFIRCEDRKIDIFFGWNNFETINKVAFWFRLSYIFVSTHFLFLWTMNRDLRKTFFSYISRLISSLAYFSRFFFMHSYLVLRALLSRSRFLSRIP